MIVLRIGGGHKAFLLQAREAVGTHQPRNALAPDSSSARYEFVMHARASVRASACTMGCSDLKREASVRNHAGRRAALLVSVVTTARYFEHGAHCTYRERHLLGCDELELHSLSFAKKVAAAF